MKKLLMLFSVLVGAPHLTACADTVKATSNEISIVQGFSLVESDPAGRMAKEHCAQFEKYARLIRKTGRIMQYSCVSRP